MEKYTLQVVFDHRNRTEDGKEGPLEVKITISRVRYYINTNIRVRRREWAGAVVNRPDAAALNERLGFLVNRIREEITSIQREGRPIDVADVKDRIWADESDNGKDSFLKWVDAQIPVLGLGVNTAKHYHTLLRRLEKFGKLRRWKDLTVENIYAFDAWLHSLCKAHPAGGRQTGLAPERISDAGVYNYHKRLKALINRAVRIGKIDMNPYDRLRGEFKRGDKENVEYLTEEEMEAIVSLHPVRGTAMALARDLFVFQLYTGMSYADTQKFDISDYKQVNGKWINTGERVKTGVPYVSHLLPPVVDVLERYGWHTPKMNNADYNHALKAIQYAAGITTRLHSHLGRHSFATWMLSKDVKVQNVMRMLGHKDIRQTMRYAKSLAKDVQKEFERVSETMKNPTL